MQKKVDKKQIKKLPYTILLILSTIVMVILALCLHGHIETPLGIVDIEEISGLFGDDLTAMENDEVIEADLEDIDEIEISNIDTIVELEEQEEESDSVFENIEPEEDLQTIDLGLFDIPDDQEDSWINIFNNGITPIRQYTPKNYNSRYFKDLGIVPLTTNGDYETVTESYFDDACWIGDSRVLGIYDYAGFNSDYYCDNGYCFYLYSKDKKVTLQNTRTKVVIQDALKEKQYKKIYVMMGINDCGYGTTNTCRELIGSFVEMLREKQPEAVIYLCGNLHISKEAESKDPEVYSLADINSKNAAIASWADGANIYYLDFNDLFCDAEGYLDSSITFDGYHLYGNQYEPWVRFFCEHAIVR